MRKDLVYLGNNPLDEKDLCFLIIKHLSRDNEVVKKNMIKYHMNEIKNVSNMLVSILGGTFVGAREFNAYFYETVSKLGYTTSSLCSPYSKDNGIREGLRI